MKKIKIAIQPELILFLSVLIYTNPDLVIPFLAACTLHELGHIAMLHCIKHCMLRLDIGIHGAVIISEALDYRQTLLAALSGPMANILGLLYWPLSPAFAYYNLILGIFNLLPLKFLDGGTILHTVLCLNLPLDTADMISRSVGVVTGVMLFITGIVAVFHFGFLPLIISGMMLFRCIKGYYLVS